ncbi:MAG: 50S ribosomal protein L24 [Candidatus Daviesbacteria bacterium GW2011_GWA2_38_24]|uniref:Large ribosomal subunit protein uL24 n=1 Tax=Candidatus Daviesbacteria bacterium GW2011_GWA2_38_24 TaxID=1618422 RepID=A0A0G0M186_9BACT|nr:MAG: 50S ribosomal protein L24 [Candidatus Daviesbacteria bacterium GW2011_GWA2_38_24]OGE24534.1 MAG: 50S ribosomal protein L24 [Candidatus Daviesbacteria bacterium RIFCSPHIGHO2_01_FULL_38_8]
MKRIKKGDKVQILLGKDRGKSGTVERVSNKDNSIFIPGLNVFKRHVRKQNQIEGGIIEISKPFNLSNVALVCPNCNKPTRVGFVINEKNGKTRVCRKCKKEI